MPEVHYNCGLILQALQRPQEAVASYEEAIRQQPHYPAAYVNRGVALKQLHRIDEALASYEQAIRLQPNDAQAHYNRGLALLDLKRLEEACASFDRTIALPADPTEALNNRGLVLQAMNRFDEALASYDQAIERVPQHAKAHANRGSALLELKQVAQALASFEHAIALQPDYAEAHNNRGLALQDLKRLDEALTCFEQAIQIKPDFVEAHWNKGLAHLLQGDEEKGWPLYEWRWQLGEFKAHQRDFPQALWLGDSALNGKTILLHAEQGLGDTLQFCRYAKQVQALGARVILEVQKPLLKILGSLDFPVQLIAKGNPLPDFDLHCPLMSLPLACQTAGLPALPACAYLSAAEDRIEAWQQRLGQSGFKIAICWQGSPSNKVDVGRSFPVALFEGIAKIEGVRLISLQKNEGTEQLAQLPKGMHIETLANDFDSRENAFLDSAAIMKCVDLVICSDTALTHLAGALGVPTWLPLKHIPDWRWQLDRADSPWYASLKLYRQGPERRWEPVLAQVKQDLLRNLCSSFPRPAPSPPTG